MMSIARPSSIKIGNVDVSLPVYFPSVSSVKTALLPLHYVEFLSSLAELNGQFLISAFDIWQASTADKAVLLGCLNDARDKGAIVLMDSGNYESYWKNAKGLWKQSDFHEVLGQTSCAFAFSFDEQFPPFAIEEHVSLIVERWKRDQNAAGEQVVIPIIHGTAAELPELAVRVAEATGVPMVAMPERKLGDGIFDRARAVGEIRKELDTIGQYIALHLLGTGNPISIAIYASFGADSFDGLEWCQTVVDHDTALLSHFTHADFFRGQTMWGDGGLSYQARTLAHNLEFYLDWMTRLREAIQTNKTKDFFRANFSGRIFNHCSAEFGWEGIS